MSSCSTDPYNINISATEQEELKQYVPFSTPNINKSDGKQEKNKV